jgi:hypothetical protein
MPWPFRDHTTYILPSSRDFRRFLWSELSNSDLRCQERKLLSSHSLL